MHREWNSKLPLLLVVSSLFVISCSSSMSGHSGSGGDSSEVTLASLKADYKRPDSIPYPADNAYTPEREKLGHMLFFDPRLSGSNVMSCATCHNPSFSWEDGLPKGIGHAHKELGRGTPTVLNLAWATRLFWDGRAGSLEEQALGPIEAAGEMNMPLDVAVSRVNNSATYRDLFEQAYPGEGVTKETIAKAIATFERGVVSGEAPFDRWLEGDEDAISESAKNGFLVFNTKANCNACHGGWSFTDHSFHDIGIDDNDIGRGAHLKLRSMQHAFKTPTLRNVDHRDPHMHNGQEKTLEEVIEFYDRGGDVKRPSLSQDVRPLHLTKNEKQDLVVFLRTLTSEDKPIEVPVLPNDS